MADAPKPPFDHNMSRHLFAIYDNVAEIFVGQPIVDRHAAPVTRMFHQLLADKSTTLNQHPKDFVLLHIGFIEDTGQLWPIEPTVIATGQGWLTSQEEAANA